MKENNTAQPGGCGNGSFITRAAYSPDLSIQADNWVSTDKEIGFRTKQDIEDSLSQAYRGAHISTCECIHTWAVGEGTGPAAWTRLCDLHSGSFCLLMGLGPI